MVTINIINLITLKYVLLFSVFFFVYVCVCVKMYLLKYFSLKFMYINLDVLFRRNIYLQNFLITWRKIFFKKEATMLQVIILKNGKIKENGIYIYIKLYIVN